MTRAVLDNGEMCRDKAEAIAMATEALRRDRQRDYIVVCYDWRTRESIRSVGRGN